MEGPIMYDSTSQLAYEIRYTLPSSKLTLLELIYGDWEAADGGDFGLVDLMTYIGMLIIF